MKSRILVLGFGLFVGSITQAMNIDQYMSLYTKNNLLLRSSEISFEAVQGKLDAAEIDLAPAFNFGYFSFWLKVKKKR